MPRALAGQQMIGFGFSVLLLLAAAGSVLWASTSSLRVWDERRAASQPSTIEKVATIAFGVLTLGYLLHVLVREPGYPPAGRWDPLAVAGLASSVGTGLLGAICGPRLRRALVLGSLGLAFLWYLRLEGSLVA